MDNPWANAWGDSDKPSYPAAVGNLWSSPSSDDQEADIGQPSWSAAPDVRWTEPSDTHDVSLWNADPPSKDWPPSTYDDLKIGATSPRREVQPEVSSPRPVELESSSSSPEPASLPPSPHIYSSTVFDKVDTEEPTKPASPRPESPDAFGTFETGVGLDVPAEDPWSPSRAAMASPEVESSPAWGTPWANDRTQPSEDEEPDEWEVAKKEKERQNRHVPPEVLAAILSDVTQLSDALWPPEEPSDGKSSSYHIDRTIDLEDIQDFSTARERLIPHDLSLPQAEPFSKTFVVKHQAETIRMTRHAPITQSSPMALFLATKGSTAWEISVKSRPEINLDAALPAGWKIEGQEEQSATSPSDKKRGGSRILSFFNRKSASSTGEIQTPEKPASPTPSMNSHASGSVVLPSPRLVADSKLPLSSSDPLTSPSITEPQIVPAEDITSISSSDPTAPPSAVSRFLNRFSRSKPQDEAERRNSLALSTDDLEFLSDIVPHASEGGDDSFQIQALTNMIGSSPLPNKLPPPLAPPPRVSPQAQEFKPPQPRSSMISEEFKDPKDDSFTWFDTPTVQPAIVPVESPVPPFSSAASKPTPLPSSFTLSPSVSSTRSNTPVEKSLPTISSASTRSKVPVIPPKRTFTAIMSSGQPNVPARIPKLNGAFKLPSPSAPRSLDRSTPSASTSPTILPPAAPIATTQNLFDDDDFSNFYESSPNPVLPPPTSSTSFASLTSSISGGSQLGLMGPPLTTPSTTNISDSMFDDFDDFVASPTRGISPPHPPTKSPQSVVLPARKTSAPAPEASSPPKRRLSRVADHSRTLSLLESAAARKGQWPAPPSPLPEALPPPIEKRESLDLFENPFAPPSKVQQDRTLADLDTITPSPTSRTPNGTGGLSLPTKSISPPLSMMHPLRPLSPPVSSKPGTPTPMFMQPTNANGASALRASTGTPGLSAQDLSFFEGL